MPHASVDSAPGAAQAAGDFPAIDPEEVAIGRDAWNDMNAV